MTVLGLATASCGHARMSASHHRGIAMNNKPFPTNLLCRFLATLLIAVTAPVLSVDSPDSPDGTVTFVAQEIANRHPEVLWQALPPSYQTDITELTHGYAARMDPTVWNTTFGSQPQNRRSSARQEDDHPRQRPPRVRRRETSTDRGRLGPHGGSPRRFLLQRCVQARDPEDHQLGKLPADHRTGPDEPAAEASKASGDDSFDRDFTQKLKKTKIEVVSRDGDQATVRASAPDEEPEDLQFTRVEGRWIPSDMAAEWDQNIADAKQRLATLSDEEIQQKSMQAMMAIGMVDGMLDELESVETSEQLEQAIQGFLGPFLGGNMGEGFMSEPSTSDPAPGTTDS